MKSNHLGPSVIIILAALTIGLAVFSPLLRQEKTSGTVADKVIRHNRVIAAKGVVESEVKIEISNQAAGLISEMQFSEGDMVKKGQILASLDNHKIMARVRLSEAQLREAEVRLKELKAGFRKEDIEIAKSRRARTDIIYEKAKNEFEKQKRLYHKGAATLDELERAEERMHICAEDLYEAEAYLVRHQSGVRAEKIEQAEASVEKAASELNYYRALLKDYTITSPINGLVVERYRDAGETVIVGTPFLKLISPHKLRIRAELEETDVGKVSEGQPVEVTVDAYQNRVYHGEVYKVFPALKRFTMRAFDPSAVYDINAQNIYARLDDFSGLKDGMQVTVKFLK